MLAFDVHNKIVSQDPGKLNAAKKREKARKANKRARAQRRKKQSDMGWLTFIFIAAIAVVAGSLAKINTRCFKCGKKLITKRYLLVDPVKDASNRVCIECFNASSDKSNSEEQSGNQHRGQ